MKQKTSRGFCGKVQITFRLKETAVRLTGGPHLSGLKVQTEEQSATAPERCGGRRRRSTARQGDRGLPSRSVHRSASVGGGGGRRRALCRRRPLLRRTAVRAVVDLAGGSAGSKLTWGLTYWRWYEATGESRAAEEFSLERTFLEPEADEGDRSRGRKAPRGPSSG